MNGTVSAKVRYASSSKVNLSLIVDLLMVTFLTFVSFQVFPLKTVLDNFLPIVQYFYIFLYFHFLLVIFPIAIFGQTLGRFIMAIKAVSKDKFESLSILQAFHHSFGIRFLSNGVEVEADD